MIKNKDVVEAYQVGFAFPLVRDEGCLPDDGLQMQWQSAHSKWQQIGEVVDAVGSNRKQLYEGREYDYVFDVDISEGQPPLKLPFNANGARDSFSKRSIKADVHAHLRESVVGGRALSEQA
jgi:hypothetical protein